MVYQVLITKTSLNLVQVSSIHNLVLTRQL